MNLLTWARCQWDRVSAVALTTAGLGVLVGGWFGISGEVYPAAQFPYLISGGLVALFLLGLGSTLWLSADLRDEWRELRRLRDEVMDVRAALERLTVAQLEQVPKLNGRARGRSQPSRVAALASGGESDDGSS